MSFTHQSLKSWLKEAAPQNIPYMVVTLLTSQWPINDFNPLLVVANEQFLITSSIEVLGDFMPTGVSTTMSSHQTASSTKVPRRPD
jgi:hypothetical protein